MYTLFKSYKNTLNIFKRFKIKCIITYFYIFFRAKPVYRCSISSHFIITSFQLSVINTYNNNNYCNSIKLEMETNKLTIF